MNNVLHLEAYEYAHIKDKLENIVFLIEGPITYILKSFEEVIVKNQEMIKLTPNSFIRISNPVIKNDGKVVYEKLNGKISKMAKLKFGDEEIRSYNNFPEPFPLYPGEEKGAQSNCKLLNSNQAIKLRAVRRFEDVANKKTREVGDEWIFYGPCLYTPSIEVIEVEEINACLVKFDKALKLIALRDFKDRRGVERISGEEWLIRELGPYIPSAEEKVVSFVDPLYVSSTTALSMYALANFTDAYNVERKIGDRWLLTDDITSIHIPDVYEVCLEKLNKIILNKWQYCKIKNRMINGKNEYGSIEIRKGECSFFLLPGEELVGNKIENVEILSKDEALLVIANENFEDDDGKHVSGERWLIKGPRSYVPPIEATILDRRSRIFLDENEGIYVRDIHTGLLKMVSKCSYLLEAHEELYEKIISSELEMMIQNEGSFHVDFPLKNLKPRDKYRVITFTVPHNAVTQVFDYKMKKNNIIFGPALVKLNPYEEFTVLELSGDNPKTERKIKTIIMRLGPDFLSDTIEVETSDHAKLLLKLTYSWLFSIDKSNLDELAKLFQVKDFVGDSCKSIASRIRGIVSSVSFDSFHKESTSIVQTGVFGKDSQGNLKKPLIFKANNFHITNVDIQSQEPVDVKIREILNNSMKLSMGTTIKIQEAEARHMELRANQDAKGKVERKQIEDETEIENKRLVLLELEANNKRDQLMGDYEANAKSKVEVNLINSESNLSNYKLNFECEKIRQNAELENQKKEFDEEIRHLKRVSEDKINRTKLVTDNEINKIESMVKSIGKETLVSLSMAGPESQAKILKSLGVKSMLITDGKNPINLFNTSQGLLGGIQQP